MKRLFPLAGAAVVIVALTACRTVGPDYTRPSLATGERFRHATNDVSAAPIAPHLAGDAWWKVFGDPELDALQDAALAQNPTLSGAVARVEETRARFRLTRSEQTAGATASGSARLAGETEERELPLPTQRVTYRERGDRYRLAAEAGFELDLWGRVKRAVESAEAQMAATEADRRGVQLVLTSEVAQAYFTWRTAASLGLVLDRTIATRRAGLEVLAARLHAGLAGEVDVQRARVELATAEAELAEVVRQRDLGANALSVLTGKPPAVKAVPRDALWLEPPQIPAGLPSALLQRRPDLAASEALLRARTAEVGIAEAARFPAIRLTGSAGFESAELGRFLGRPSQFWQLGPSFSVPLLDSGKSRADVAIAEARLGAAAAEFQQRCLSAFREVEDSLVELRQQREQASAHARGAMAAAEVLSLATTRFERGFATYLEVVDAQRSVLQVERAQAELAGARYVSTVKLVRALGGGWDSGN
jgi:multidrug efflux system outer membrane protein